LFALQHRCGDIKGTIASAVVGEVRIPVITGTDNIQVFIFFTGGKPARA